MQNPVIVDAIRTPAGRRNGALKDVHPVELLGHVLKALQERNGFDPADVDDVISGCVMQMGDQAVNIARNAVLAAGWPERVPGTTVDRQCGSAQQALHFAAQGVMAGVYDMVVAAGVESMTRVPMGSTIENELAQTPWSESIVERYAPAGGLVNQGVGAEMIADRWGFSRADLDAYAAQSHQRAAKAYANGHFDNELVPVPLPDGGLLTADEGLRAETTSEVLGGLRSSFKDDGKITAGNASQIADGASAVLVMSEERAAALGLRPRARFHGFAVEGADPVSMLTGPIPATQKVLQRTGLSIDDIDRFEVNEAFAPVVLAWAAELGADLERVNVNGGAIALGHPLGSSGTKLTSTLLNALEQSGGRYGLLTMCEGGGMANATIIERI